MFASQPFASFAWAAVSSLPATSNDFNRLARSTDEKGLYLVEVTLQKLDANAGRGSNYPWASKAWASAPVVSSPDPPITLIFSDAEWISEPDDPNRPNNLAWPILSQKADIEKSVTITPGNTSRRSSSNFGQLGMVNAQIEGNTQGILDDYIYNYSVDGQLVRVLYGPARPRTRYNQFTLIAELFGREFETDNTEAKLTLRDAAFLLDRNFSPREYTGNGGPSGDAELAGIPMPVGVGQVFNAIPRKESNEFNIFSVHYTQIETFTELRDRGIPVVVYEDDTVSSWEELSAKQATVPIGQVVFAPKIGKFCIGGTLTGDEDYRVDFKGHNLGGYEDQIGPVLLSIATDMGKVSTEFLDSPSFKGFKTGKIGYYFNGDTSPLISNVFDELLAADNGIYGGLEGRQISLAKLRAPELATAQFELEPEEIIKIENIINPQPTVSTFEITYDFNFGKQTEQSLALDVDAVLRSRITKDYQRLPFENGQVLFTHKSSADLGIIRGYYVDKSDANNAADNLDALYGVQRKLIRITTKRVGLIFNIGSIIKLNHHRLGPYNGNNFVIVSKREVYSDNRVEIICYG